MKKKLIAITLCFLSLFALANREDVTSEHRALANQQIKKLGLAPEDIEFKKEDVDIFISCSNGISPQGETGYLMVNFMLKKPKTLKGIPLAKGTYIQLCDGDVHFISGSGTHLIDGYKCESGVYFDFKGKLCGCKLAETTTLEGIEIPKGTTVHWRESKPYAIGISSDSVKIKNRLLEVGHYQFIKGNLKFQKYWETVNTCEKEIYNQ